VPWPLGTGELQTRLKQMLGIRGNLPLELDESILPVVNVLDFESGPVTYPLVGSAFRDDAAVAAQFSHVGVRPAVGSILVVDRVILINDNAALIKAVIGITLDPAEDASERIICMNKPPSGAALGLTFIGATAFDRTQAATLVSTTDGATLVPIGTGVEVKGPWVLHAPDESSQMTLVVRPDAVNVKAAAWFFMREYNVT